MKVVWTHRAIRHLVAIRNHIAKDSSIRIDAGTKRRLEALSQSVNRSKSFLAAEAITNYVEAEE